MSYTSTERSRATRNRARIFAFYDHVDGKHAAGQLPRACPLCAAVTKPAEVRS